MTTGTISVPDISLGSGSPGNSASATGSALSLMLQNLMSGAADLKDIRGLKTLVIGAGAIGSAGSIQIGNTETAEQVAANLTILTAIADFCKANGIVVQVDASLTNPATYSDGKNALVDQWASAAAKAGLPIVSVEDVGETAISVSSDSFAAVAAIEANAIRTLIQDYAGSSYALTAQTLAVGDMEGGGATDVANIAKWIAALNTATSKLGLQSVSYVTADTGWFAPWIDPLSQTNWQGYLAALSNYAASAHIALNVVIQAPATNIPNFVLQAEQHAVSLLLLQARGLVHVSNLSLVSWQTPPVGVGTITSPTSMVNEAAELDAVAPLYVNGSITAAGGVTTSTPGQIILNTGVVRSFVPLTVQMAQSDVTSNLRLGVVIIDQTGTLAATRSGSGTVSNLASNILVLTGTATDLAKELASVTLLESVAGPDTIDVQTWGTQGRLSDNQIAVVATIKSTGGVVVSTNPQQGWLTANDVFNTGTVAASGSILTSQTLTWSPTGTTASGQPAFLNTVAIHDPLAEYGVHNTPNGVRDIFDPSVDNGAFPNGGYANNPAWNNVSLAENAPWNGTAFNADAELTALTVTTTVNTFDPVSGRLWTSVSTLSPNNPTIIVHGTAVPDSFATTFTNGGRQVIIANTGNNPSWQAGWGSQFSAATLTYSSTGKLVEMFLQGTNPAFTIDNIYDPITGQLWEQFQSASPPPGTVGGNYTTTNNPYQPGFDTGPLYQLQENLPGNPNWNGVDWGNVTPVVTEVWTDYFIMASYAGFAINMSPSANGDMGAYPLQFVNGTALDLFGLPGTIVVDLNALGTVTIQSITQKSRLSGLTQIDAWGSTGSVTLTGLAAGGSTLIGGDNTTTINGYGHDTIIAGAGVTTINTGNGGSTIRVTDGASHVNLNGNGNTVTAMGGSTVSATGTGDVITFTGGGTFQQGASSSAVLNGNSIVAWMSGSGGAVTVTGNGDTVTGGTGASITLSGNSDTAGAGIGSTVTVNGQGDVVYATGTTIIIGTAASNLQVFGDTNTITASNRQTVGLTGIGNQVSGSNLTVRVGGSGVITGSNNAISGGGLSVSASASGSQTDYLIIGGANGTSAEFLSFGKTSVGVRISNGAGLTINDTVPASVISSAVALPPNMVFATSANRSVQASSRPEQFVVQPVSGGSFTITGFDTGQDVIALSYALFGSAQNVLSHSHAVSGGVLISNGNNQVLLAGMSMNHFGIANILPI